MGPIKLSGKFVGCTLNFNTRKITLKISNPYLIVETKRIFHSDAKKITKLSIPIISSKGVIRKIIKDTLLHKDL